MLAGCAQVSPEYDPINWATAAKHEVKSWFGDESPEPAPIPEPPPGEGRPFPNLGTVPPPPFVTPDQRKEREQQLAALEADRAAAAKADAAMRGEPAPNTSTPGTAAPGPAANASPAATPASPAGSTTSGNAAAANADSAAANTTEAAPAPIIEVPSLPPAEANAARSAAHLLATSERHGAVSFGPQATSLSAGARNTLDAAAASAVTNDGRVRLEPAQIDGTPAASDLMAAREAALRQALTGAGVPANRITIGNVGGRRVDVYDVYVDY